MGVLGSIVQPFVLSMFYVLHHLLLRCFVAFEFIGDNHSWHEALFFQDFALIIALLLSCPDEVVATLLARCPQRPLPATSSIAVF